MNSLFSNLKFDYQAIDDSSLLITGYSGKESELEIPSKLKRMNVAGIGNRAFSDFVNLTGITIPDGVSSIGDYAFSGCAKLTSVVLPETIKTIGNHAFSGCEQLQTITIPYGVEVIGNGAFSNCHNLKVVKIPESADRMGKSLFEGCPMLESVMVTNSVGLCYELDINSIIKGSDSSRKGYVCPYCGKEILNDSVLFWEKVKQEHVDKVRSKSLSYFYLNNFPRVYYKVNPWSNVEQEDENGFPTVISECLDHSIIPEELDEKDGFDSDGFSEYDEFEDTFDDEFDSDFSPERKRPESVVHKIDRRACPHCHCDLPQKFGTLDTYHVAVCGGNASGKTAYLLSLFRSLEKYLTEHNLGSIKIEDESASFLALLIHEYEVYETTSTTPADRTFPIVCHYQNSKREAYLVFHDIPCDGASDPVYLAGHAGLPRCETLLLMIDPNSVSVSYGDLATQWYHVHFGSDLYGVTPDCCLDSLKCMMADTSSLCRQYAPNKTNVIAVITKLDMLLEFHRNREDLSSGNMEFARDGVQDHYGAVNMVLTERVGTEFETFFDNVYNVNLRAELIKTFGNDVNIRILGTAATTGHRIAEPFLVTLMLLNLVPYKNGEDKTVWCIMHYDDADRLLQKGAPPTVKTLAEMFFHPEEEKTSDIQTISSDDDFDF